MWYCASLFVVFMFVAEKLVDSMNITNSTDSPQTATIATKHYVQDTIFGANIEMIHRAFYVLIGISVLAVLYFVIRTVRLRKPPRKKYGLLSDYDENMEMGSMDSDEEKIFEARNIRR
ncbi:protein FAM174C [Rhinophrynus dorsalis]